MKNVFTLCFQSDSKTPESVVSLRTFKVSSLMELETFGQLEKQENGPGDIQRKMATKKTNSSHQDSSKTNLIKHEIKNNSHKSSQKDSKKEKHSKPRKIQKTETTNGQREIAIQAGSPLSNTRDKKTRTVLSYSQDDPQEAVKPGYMHKPLFKNPWNSKKIEEDVKPIKKTSLGPVKKGIPTSRHTCAQKKKGDSILEPLDKSIIEKNKINLVPVDKDFIRRLEKENILFNAKTCQENSVETKKTKSTSSSLSRLSNSSNESDGDKHNQLKSMSEREEELVEEENEKEDKENVLPENEYRPMEEDEEQTTIAQRSSNTDDDDNNNTTPVKKPEKDPAKINEMKRIYGDSYDSDELDLMEEIEKEFGNI